MIKERCYFMGGIVDGTVWGISPHSSRVRIPELIMTIPYSHVNHEYIRTRLLHDAPHPLHGVWPITVYALVERL